MDKKDEGMAEAYLIEKWNILYDYLDVNRDGLLDYEEMMTFPKRLIGCGKMGDGEKLQSYYNELWTRLCKINNIPSGSQSLQRQQWIVGVEGIRTSEWFTQSLIPTISRLYFETIDRDHDEFITLDEWRSYQKNRGLEKESVVQAIFKRMDRDGDGRISRDEVEYAITQFAIGDNPAEDYSFLYKIN